MGEADESDPTLDAELLGRIAQRDPDALAILYDRYGGLAFALTMRIVGDPGLAEDVLQDAFFNVWRNAASYTLDRGGVRAWVLSIVRNQSIDKLRRIRNNRRLDVELDPLQDILPPAPDAWGEVSAHLERERISEALLLLPKEQRTTIELAFFGGLTHSEIASKLRIPLGTVKGRLRLGMDKLRVSLAEPGLEPC